MGFHTQIQLSSFSLSPFRIFPFSLGYIDLFSYQDPVSPLVSSPRHRPLSASNLSVFFRRPIVQLQFDEDSRLASFRNGKFDVGNIFNQAGVALSSYKQDLEEETVARRTMVSVLGGLQEKLLQLRAENYFIQELKHKLMQKVLSASYENTGKKIERLYGKVFPHVLRISSRVDQGLASWLTSRESKLRPNVDHLDSQLAQPKQAVSILYSDPAPRLLRSLALFLHLPPRRALHSLRVLLHFLACLSHQRRASHRAAHPHSSLPNCKEDFISTLSNNPVFLRSVVQAIRDVASKRVRIAFDTFFQALYYNQLLFDYNFAVSLHF